MRETLRCLLLLFLLSPIQAALWEEGSTRREETEENTTSDLAPRTDFVRIVRASGERHERQISRRLEAFGDGERHMITVDRNGNILQFRRPPPSSFFSLQSSPFRQSPFFGRGITRSRSSHGFSRRRPTRPPPSISPLITNRPPTTTVTHDGSMAFFPTENTLQPPTVTREGTVTNDFRRVPVRTPNRPSGRIHSLRLVHGGSMEGGEGSSERVPIARPMRERPLRISSSFEVLPRRDNDRFRIGGPPFGEVTTPAPSTRVFIQTPRPFRPRPPPIRQRPQPPRRVEALSNDEQEFIPSGRTPISPSVVAPFRSFRPRLPSTRFTLPPRSPIRTGPSPLHTSPSTLSSTTFSSTEPSTSTTHTTTPSTTSATESSTTQLTTPSSTTMEATSSTEGTTFGTTATTSRPTISSISTFSSRRPTVSQSTISRSSTRELNPVSPFLHSSSFLRPTPSTLPPSTLEPLHLTSPPSSTPSTSPSPFPPSTSIPIQRDPLPITQSNDTPSSFEDSREFESISSATESSLDPPSTESSTLPSSFPTSTTPSPPPSTTTFTSLSTTTPSSPSSPDASSLFRDSPTPFINQNVRIITTTRSSLSSHQFDLSDLPDEFNFESSTESSEGPPTTRSKPILPRTDKVTATKPSTSIGKTTTVPKSSTVTKTTTASKSTTVLKSTTFKSTTVTPAVSRVTPPPTTKTRRTGTTRGFATVSPSISVKALPPAIPDDLSFNGIRGPLPPSPLPSHPSHSTTGLPPTGRAPSFPPSSSFDGPPGEMPPSDNVVQMLNDADDFLEMARRLNITRKARIARRRRRMAEYGRSSW